MGKPSTPTIESCLRPREKLLWSGRPQHEAGEPDQRRVNWLQPALTVIAIIAGLWIVMNQLPDGALDQITGGMLPPGAIVGIIGLILIAFVLPRVLKAFKIDNQSRLDRYFLSQAYAITDQRLIIVSEGNTRSYGPEDLTQLKVCDRGDGTSDVRFYQVTQSGSEDARIKDPVAIERGYVGFMKLDDAESVKRQLERWKSERLNEAEEGVQDFSADTGSGQSFRNPTTSLLFRIPESWQVEVRKKKEPHGKTFVDNERWQQIGETDDWNTVRVTGPMDCQVLFELFETEPTVTLDSMTKGFLVKMLVGNPTETDLDYELNGMPGFALTYGKDLLGGKGQPGSASGTSLAAQRSRAHVLHDGRRQLYIVSRWPEDSAELGEAVDAIVQSIRVS